MRGHQENCRSRNHGSSAGGPAPRCRRRRSHQIWRPERTAKSCHRGLLTVAKGFSRLPVPKAIEGAAMTKFHFILDVKLPPGSPDPMTYLDALREGGCDEIGRAHV